MAAALTGKPGGWVPNENTAALCCILAITAYNSPAFAMFLTVCVTAGAYFNLERKNDE
jgi:hypothetical protein